jgi:hypothetical protein
MRKKEKISEVSVSYVRGLIDATVSLFEEINWTVDTEIEWHVTEINNGIKVQAVWRNGEVHEDNERELSDSWFNVYSKDTVDSVVSDISSILNEIK